MLIHAAKWLLSSQWLHLPISSESSVSGSSGISSCLRHCSTSLVPSSKEQGHPETSWDNGQLGHDNWMQAKPETNSTQLLTLRTLELLNQLRIRIRSRKSHVQRNVEGQNHKKLPNPYKRIMMCIFGQKHVDECQTTLLRVEIFIYVWMWKWKGKWKWKWILHFGLSDKSANKVH